MLESRISGRAFLRLGGMLFHGNYKQRGYTGSFFFPSQSVVYCHGGRIGFFQGDIRLLSDDMKALRPTIFPVVPRLLNRMYDKVSFILFFL